MDGELVLDAMLLEVVLELVAEVLATSIDVEEADAGAVMPFQPRLERLERLDTGDETVCNELSDRADGDVSETAVSFVLSELLDSVCCGVRGRRFAFAHNNVEAASLRNATDGRAMSIQDDALSTGEGGGAACVVDAPN
ncbi:hypothetical protein TRAPUB_12595 [Trametes pubescens]|uniref:Uncharacterized protein n=1 Tax=Trametes pubescens TaxID=154538 RepID=A0A1M2VTJ6_TRAPU|nr:hypothetical protein TRAPUB_12595 [Trametes pubescens]